MGEVKPSKMRKKIQEKKGFVSWFEIPAIDFQQAVKFYETIFGITLQQNINDTNAMAFFPTSNGVGGAVVYGPGYVPGDSGALLYLNGGNDLSEVLDKVVEAGGRIIMKKTLISEDAGYFAIFIDSQGNKLALHSNH
jgi:uncharacterized protein